MTNIYKGNMKYNVIDNPDNIQNSIICENVQIMTSKINSTYISTYSNICDCTLTNCILFPGVSLYKNNYDGYNILATMNTYRLLYSRVTKVIYLEYYTFSVAESQINNGSFNFASDDFIAAMKKMYINVKIYGYPDINIDWLLGNKNVKN